MQPKGPSWWGGSLWPFFRCVGNGRKKKSCYYCHELICFPPKEKVQEIMTIQSPTSYIHLLPSSSTCISPSIWKAKMKKVLVCLAISQKSLTKMNNFFISLNTSIVSSQDHCWVVPGNLDWHYSRAKVLKLSFGCQVSKFACLPGDPSKLLSILDYLQLNLRWRLIVKS
jgi:hypothetical protein